MRHEVVEPEMLDALRRWRWHNHSHRGLPFGYLEAGEGFQKRLEGMVTEEVNTRWQEFMAPYLEGIPGHPDESMVELGYAFCLE